MHSLHLIKTTWNSLGVAQNCGMRSNKVCFNFPSSAVGNPGRSLHPFGVQQTSTLRPKKDSKVSFTPSVGILEGLRSLGYLPMTTSAGSNSSASRLITLDGKALDETFEVTARGGHLCSVVAAFPGFWNSNDSCVSDQDCSAGCSQWLEQEGCSQGKG